MLPRFCVDLLYTGTYFFLRRLDTSIARNEGLQHKLDKAKESIRNLEDSLSDKVDELYDSRRRWSDLYDSHLQLQGEFHECKTDEILSKRIKYMERVVGLLRDEIDSRDRVSFCFDFVGNTN